MLPLHLPTHYTYLLDWGTSSNDHSFFPLTAHSTMAFIASRCLAELDAVLMLILSLQFFCLIFAVHSLYLAGFTYPFLPC